MEAASALGVQHGDISLACRGLKDNIRGFRFRFQGEEWVNPATRPKKNALDARDDDDVLMTRTSKYRGDFEKGGNKSSFILPPVHIKVALINHCHFAIASLSIAIFLINFCRSLGEHHSAARFDNGTG